MHKVSEYLGKLLCNYHLEGYYAGKLQPNSFLRKFCISERIHETILHSYISIWDLSCLWRAGSHRLKSTLLEHEPYTGWGWNMKFRWWCEVYLPPCQWQPWECMWQKDRQGKCENYHNQKIELPWFVTSNWSPCFTAGHMLVCSWLPRQPTMP